MSSAIKALEYCTRAKPCAKSSSNPEWRPLRIKTSGSHHKCTGTEISSYNSSEPKLISSAYCFHHAKNNQNRLHKTYSKFQIWKWVGNQALFQLSSNNRPCITPSYIKVKYQEAIRFKIFQEKNNTKLKPENQPSQKSDLRNWHGGLALRSRREGSAVPRAQEKRTCCKDQQKIQKKKKVC